MNILDYYLNEFSLVNKEDKTFKDKEKLALSNFKMLKLTNTNINKYKPKAKSLSHVRDGDNYTGTIYVDKEDDVVAYVVIDTENKSIQALEVLPNYKGSGLSKQLLDVATKFYKANNLSVNKKNQLAFNIYKKYGFKKYKESENMYFMKL